MLTKQLTGTRDDLEKRIRALAIPVNVLAPDAVRNYIIAHLPILHDRRYQLTLNVQSINNSSFTTMAGHLTVVVKELAGDHIERNTE